MMIYGMKVSAGFEFVFLPPCFILYSSDNLLYSQLFNELSQFIVYIWSIYTHNSDSERETDL